MPVLKTLIRDTSNVVRLGRLSLNRRAFLLSLFCAAVAIRWIYDLTLYSFMGDQWLMVGDSAEYTSTASAFVASLKAGTSSWLDWLGTGPYRMPLFHWLAALPYLAFGEKYAVIGYVLMQGLFDAGTCVIVFYIAEFISPGVARIAAIVSAINPTQIVLAGIFYTDTPFTFFFALTFFSLLRWSLSPTWKNSSILGVCMACAALVRAIIVPWGALVLVLVAGFSFWSHARKATLTIVVGALIFASGVSIILTKNALLFGTPRLSPQTGYYYAGWVVPLAQEMYDRTPWSVTFDKIMKQTRKRFGPPSANAFEESDRMQIIGREFAKNIPFSAFVKSFMSGMFINLSSPGILLSPPILLLPRTGFYDTTGNSFPEKVFNFAFRSENAKYSFALIVGAVGIVIVRLLELYGLLTLARVAPLRPALLLGGTWLGYLLLVSGPIASPKYRLPLEPLFNIASAAGVCALRRRVFQ